MRRNKRNHPSPCVEDAKLKTTQQHQIKMFNGICVYAFCGSSEHSRIRVGVSVCAWTLVHLQNFLVTFSGQRAHKTSTKLNVNMEHTYIFDKTHSVADSHAGWIKKKIGWAQRMHNFEYMCQRTKKKHETGIDIESKLNYAISTHKRPSNRHSCHSKRIKKNWQRIA